ncbi:MAG: PQQ-binding-like beta-propeller repeat protein [Planctomycetes bacterium]|nr:PQQ-binding-like beta-propeller repeat protein [Planctomycetota bacterium]MBI3833643.1 PQQ-binding-like beta-propeller repeat protein [Planctomycetota bacterium]
MNSTQRFVSLQIIACMCFCSAVTAAPNWPTYQANPAHTGYVPVTLDASRFALRWEKLINLNQDGLSVLNPVAAGDGKVFVSTHSIFYDVISLLALSAADGSTLWTKDFGFVSSVNPPAYSNGNVYIQIGRAQENNGRAYLRAFYANNGDLQFESEFGAQGERYYAPTIVDGTVYIDGGTYGGMYAFDGISGSQNWFISLNQWHEWTPAVDAQYAYAYLGGTPTGNFNPGVWIVDRTFGTQSGYIFDPNFFWHPPGMKLAPVLGGQNDLLVIEGGRLLSFDLANQQIRYELSENFTGQVSVANGVVFAINSGALTARDQATGSLLWSWSANSALQGEILVTRNHAFVRTQDSTYAVDLNSHQQVWSYPKAGPMAWSEDVLYIAGSDLVLTAIDAPPPSCDDGVSCTVDTYNQETQSCDHIPSDTRCDDGNVCTDDSCDLIADCIHVNNSIPCDDGSACTINDICSDGHCVPSAPLNCDDGNFCTDDSCDPASGCVHANNSNSCDDGNACTTTDTCNSGSCVGGPPLNCNDGDDCTDDSCNQTSGCVHENICGACCDQSTGLCASSTLAGECTCARCQWSLGASCEDANCTQVFVPIPTVSTWGATILSLALLVIAKIRFARPSAYR